MKKKLTYCIVAILAASAVSLGCGVKPAASNEPAPTTTTTQARRQTTTTTAPKQDILVEAFVLAMKDWFPNMTRSDAIELGVTMCDTIDIYGNVSDTVDAIIASGRFRGMEGDIGYVMGVSIPVYCPQYEAEAQRLFR